MGLLCGYPVLIKCFSVVCVDSCLVYAFKKHVFDVVRSALFCPCGYFLPRWLVGNVSMLVRLL